MDSIVVFALFVLFSCEAQETPVFERTGTDLLLDVNKVVTLKKVDILTWTFNGSTNIARLLSNNESSYLNNYESRAELFPKNHSLLLKNVQLSDSGVYTARVEGDKITHIANYKLTVQDPVSRVELKVKSCSSNRSNLTVICRTLDSLISSTFTCSNQTCSHDGGEETSPGASLDVHLNNGSVICNHSNQVSSEEDTRKIEDLCGKSPERHATLKATVDTTALAIALVVLVVLVAGVVGLFLYRQRKRKQQPEAEGMENTVYAEPEVRNTDLPKEKKPTDDASADSPLSVYSLLGPPTEPTEPKGPTGPTGATVPTSQEAPTQIRVNMQPESLYATVEKPAKS